MRADLLRLAVQIKHLAHPCGESRLARLQRFAVVQLQCMLIIQRLHAEPAALAIELHATCVAVRLQAFHPSQGAQGKVRMELLPLPGRLIGQ